MRNKKLFNEIARERFKTVIEENGMKILFASKKCEIEYTTLSKWKNGVFDFKDDKLSRIEGFVKRY